MAKRTLHSVRSLPAQHDQVVELLEPDRVLLCVDDRPKTGQELLREEHRRASRDHVERDGPIEPTQPDPY